MRKYLEFAALLLLAGLMFWWFGRGLDWAEVKSAVRQSDGRLVATAAMIVCGAYLIRALRWRALLAPLTPASIRELFVATTVGFTAVFLIGRVGEVVRPVVLPMRDRRVRPGAAFVTIVVERIYDSMTVLSLFALNLLWFRLPANSLAGLSGVRATGVVLVLAAVIGLGLLVWFKRRSESILLWLDAKLSRSRLIPARVKRGFISLLEQLAVALGVLANRRDLAITAGWSLLLWLSIAAANLLVFRAFGMPFGLSQTLFVLGWSMVGSIVPTPGGAAGAFHAATAAGLLFLGIERAQAVGVTIVLHLVDFAPAVIFGVYYFLRGDINIARLRHLASSDSVEHAVEDEKIRQMPSLRTEELETAVAGK
ncbi:MAG: lysylphosphatidylglycerol synthase transmembrane domain-containing protein [Pyrinomonadaceae bacterium]